MSRQVVGERRSFLCSNLPPNPLSPADTREQVHFSIFIEPHSEAHDHADEL